jgi:two-component system, sensor histidine kinase and response regulator
MVTSITKTGEISWPMQVNLASRILVADDDPILREFAIVHLTTPQVEVEVAEDGLFALERLKRGGIDIALVDLDMPRMNGFELIKAIRADPELAHLPVVVVTGREDMEAVDRAYQSGATSFVVKPLNWRLLSHQLAYVLRNSRAEHQVRLAKKIVEDGAKLKTNLLRLLRHELSTPMNAILGFGQLIESHAAEPATKSHARHILAAAGQLKRANDTISQAAHALAGDLVIKPRRFLVADLLKTGTRHALINGGKVSDLKLVDKTGQAEFDADWEMLVGALSHLIGNAIAHGSAPIAVTSQLNCDGRLILQVEDSGKGVPADKLSTLCEPFALGNQVLNHGSKAGLGLGLSIVSAYVHAHKGALHLSNGSLGGLCCQIEIPLNKTEVLMQTAA